MRISKSGEEIPEATIFQDVVRVVQVVQDGARAGMGTRMSNEDKRNNEDKR